LVKRHISIVYPTISSEHPDFKWTSGADVQATWKRFGWTPIFTNQPPVYVEPKKEPAFVTELAKRRKGA
jgi:hypothetical protein